MFIVPSLRSALRPLSLLLGLVLSAAAVLAQSPSAADGFDPNVDGNVYVMATQADGKLLVAGQFSTLRPAIGAAEYRNNLARLNPDGSVDTAFNPDVGGAVRALVLLPNGDILIGGDFTTVAGVKRNYVARLKGNGSLDAFNPNVYGGPFPQVNALVVQPNGKIVVGGRFTSTQPNGTGAVIVRNNLARFNADGTLDAAYNPNPNSLVLAMVSHLVEARDFAGNPRLPVGDGKLVISGGFTSLQPGGTSTTQTPGSNGATGRNRVARLNPDGTVDSEFDPNANNAVATLAVQRDGKIILGGSFTTLQPVGTSLVTTRNRLARLNPDGTLDSEFYPNVGGSVVSVALAPDGAIMVGGYFTSIWGVGNATTARSYVARLNPNGSLDLNFNAGANYAVAAFAFQPDGKIILGGYFTALQSRGTGTAIARNRLARVTTDGTLDTTLSLDGGGRPLVTLPLSDGKLLVGGSFTSIGGLTRNYLARLNADGSLDASFNPAAPNGRVLALARDTQGRIILGGTFTLVGSTARNYLARLNVDGSLDAGYDPNPNAQVGTIVMQGDKALVGGTFSAFLPNGTTTYVNRGYIARINADGTVDSFDPGANSTVAAIVLQGDKILLGGAFTAFTPNAGTSVTSRSYLARLNADGLLDTTFTPLLNGRVNSIVLQSDGKLIAGGAFTLFQPPGATSVTTTVNGVTTTTSTAVTRNRLIRINSDGTYDPSFDAGEVNNTVLTLALQNDGKIIAGGTFLAIQPVDSTKKVWNLRKYVARFDATGKFDPSFNLDLNEINGNRVDSLALQSITSGTATQQKLIVGGNFTSIAPGSTGAGATRVAANHYVRINADGSLDSAFVPGAGGSSGGGIAAMSIQGDGKIIAVGNFTDIGGTRTTNVARFLAEGSPDLTFASSLDADGPVAAILQRQDANPVTTQGNGLAWLNSDGSLRNTLNLSVRLSGQISAIATQADGSILLGGSFINTAGTTGNNLVRISATGVIDTSFSPSPDGDVASISVQKDGKILVGGTFSNIASTARNNVARLNPNGSIDTTFDPNASGRVNAIVVQENDQKIILGGAFTTLQPTGTTTAVTRNYIARLETSGAVDTGYNPSASATVSALVLQPDGMLLLGGSFTSLTPGATGTAYVRNYIARLKTDGTVDTFDPSASAAVNAIALYPSAGNELKVIVGGAFNYFSPNSLGNTTIRNYIARLNADGTVDSNFNPNANGNVNSVAVQADGSVIFAGVFTAVQPNTATEATVRNRIARVDFSGALDVAFNPDANNTVDVVSVYSSKVDSTLNGSILVGGSLNTVRPNGVMLLGGKFANIGGVASRNLALINDDGTVSGAFQPNPNGEVTTLLNLPNGSTLVGGDFTTIAGATRNRLARFNDNGTLDTGYAPNFNGTVRTVVIQGDSQARVIVGGSFTQVNGAARANLARLLPDGSTDAQFNPTIGAVRALALQGDGKIIVLSDGSGVRSLVSRLNADGSADSTFTPFNSAGSVINAIAVQADGKILVGGAFATFLRRLNANGTVDTTFNPQPNAAVTAITLQGDGRVLIAGGFSQVGSLLRTGIARLASTSPARRALSINPAGTNVSYERGGTAPEASSVIISRSDDAVTWTTVGNAVRATGTNVWSIPTTALPASGNVYFRARAVITSGGGTSSGFTEHVQEVNRANIIAAEVLPAPLPGPSTNPPDSATPATPPIGGAPVSGFRIVADVGSLNQAVTAARLATTPGSERLAHLTNLSTRAPIAADNVLTTGFAIAGTGERTVLVRAVGPGLAGFKVAGTLAEPLLRLFDASGNVLAENSGWSNSAALVQAATMTGAFPLAPGSADAAILVTLAPGAYTLQVSDANGTRSGIALAEVYDVAGGSDSRLANVSSRSSLTASDGILISGFVVAGSATVENLLVRGVGPGLVQFGVTNALSDPTVAVFDGSGGQIATNDNWSATAATKTALVTGATSVGAFALTDGSKDAAVLLSLTPGAYTAQVTAASGAPGNTLLEIYELK